MSLSHMPVSFEKMRSVCESIDVYLQGVRNRTFSTTLYRTRGNRSLGAVGRTMEEIITEDSRSRASAHEQQGRSGVELSWRPRHTLSAASNRQWRPTPLNTNDDVRLYRNGSMRWRPHSHNNTAWGRRRNQIYPEPLSIGSHNQVYLERGSTL
jgi:hypothetical protein